MGEKDIILNQDQSPMVLARSTLVSRGLELSARVRAQATITNEDWYSRLHAAALDGDPDAQFVLGICHMLPIERGKSITVSVFYGNGLPMIFTFANTPPNEHQNSTNYLLLYTMTYTPPSEQPDPQKFQVECVLICLYYIWKCQPRETKSAEEWFLKAAQQDHTTAQLWLGYMYDKGWGVPENCAEAERWFCAAATQGNVEAMRLLGDLMSNRMLDDFAAEKWYRLAAVSGDEAAQQILAEMGETDLIHTQDSF